MNQGFLKQLSNEIWEKIMELQGILGGIQSGTGKISKGGYYCEDCAVGQT